MQCENANVVKLVIVTKIYFCLKVVFFSIQIKTDLRDVINCNSVIQNNLGLWQLYDLVFERAAMLDGVIIELNSIYLRFDAALTSCQSYGECFICSCFVAKISIFLSNTPRLIFRK